MARVVLSPAAFADVEGILRDLAAKAGNGVADRYAEDFGAAFRRLALFPEIGPLRPRLGAHIRVSVVSPYLIVHRHVPGDETVNVLRLLHGRQNITRSRLRER